MTSRSFIVRIYIVALILRLIPVLLSRGLGIGLDDMFQYDMLARSLASGNGYRWYAQADLKQLASYIHFDLHSVKGYDPVRGMPTSFRAPLYPAFLALVYLVSGTGFSRFFAARLAQAVLLGAPLAPLTYLVARKLFPSLSLEAERGQKQERAARIAAWIVAGYPMLLVYPLGLGTENPFFVLLLTSVYFLLRSVENYRAMRAPGFSRPGSQETIPLNNNIAPLMWAGLFLGLTMLTRSVILPFVGLAFLWLLYALGRRSFIFLLSFLLVVTPWVIRNSLLYGRLTPVETSMGYNLYLGYYPTGNGSFVFGPSLDLLPILDDSVRDKVGIQKAMEFIRADPARILPLAVNRLGFFFGLEKRVLMYFYSNNLLGYLPFPFLLAISLVLLLPFVAISISAALSLPALHWNINTALVTILFLGYLLPHVLILSEDRFHLALVPFIAIFAAQFWTGGFPAFAARWQESNTGRWMTVLSVLLVFLLLFNWSAELSRDADKIAALLGPNGNEAHFPY